MPVFGQPIYEAIESTFNRAANDRNRIKRGKPPHPYFGAGITSYTT